MILKYRLIILYIILFCSFKINFCIYLSSGIITLNKFLYSSRISTYDEQNEIGTCSLSDGPNCFFSEKKYINHYLKTNNEDKNSIINDEWVYFYSKIQNKNYETILNNLSKYTTNYIDSYSEKIDSDQNPQTDYLGILMTFDDDTTKKNMFLKKLTNIFYNEKLIADFEGRLRLYDDEGLPEKDEKNTKYGDNYPSKLYGIIESEFITISFRGKFFICNYVYIRAHDEQSKLEEIKFYGFLGENIKFEYSYTDNKERKEKWLKVFFPPEVEVVDKLVISGPYELIIFPLLFYIKLMLMKKKIIICIIIKKYKNLLKMMIYKKRKKYLNYKNDYLFFNYKFLYK